MTHGRLPDALSDDAPQFPRQQWARQPAARTAALIVCEALLDSADELTDEQWLLVCYVMQYGGVVVL